jgi:hypothetical protein
VPTLTATDHCEDDLGESSQCQERAEFRALEPYNRAYCAKHLVAHLRHHLQERGPTLPVIPVMRYIPVEES